ncbi:MAG: radical SAM protein [Candidatus Omnitrophica bacterium]|nr:radical SAM protein [Candidatus Omnitrophota bacterium]MBD3269182.1 radical SAM protein [Candidatus Omnitrophota bacterium]
MSLPYLVFSDSKGKIFEHPGLRMSAQDLDGIHLPRMQELIPAPSGTTYFYLPHRHPVGFNPSTGEYEVIREFKGREVFAVSAFPPPAYLRLYYPAFEMGNFTVLPLWAYTATGFYSGRFYICATRVDRRLRQSPPFYDNQLIQEKIKSLVFRFPSNRLYKHLANCALNYNCLAAKNLFLNRWEAPLPTSRFCNAACIGCLSLQNEGCTASHQRISFRPSVDEVSEIMIKHLREAKEAIVSFGQGCEGEPLLETNLISQSVRNARAVTLRGTINMNTNASIPENVKELCKAGIDSFRVSLNSPRRYFYKKYFRPRGYNLRDVIKSIRIAKRLKKFVSVNLFIFPGFSDEPEEIKSLFKLMEDVKIDMLQLRNLNIDPYFFAEKFSGKKNKAIGLLNFIRELREKYPDIKLGYFNLPKENF